MSIDDPYSVLLAGVSVQAVSGVSLLQRIDTAMAEGQGGWVVTANVDVLRIVTQDPDSRRLMEVADIVVPDGAPLVWASRLAGIRAPERLTGADLLWSMSEIAARRGRSVFVAGGPPGSADGCATALAQRYPELEIAGTLCPPFGFHLEPEVVDAVCTTIAATGPGLVLVGMGFPKQEHLIERLRESCPEAWFLGCGAAVNFAAGTLPRAPVWMQRSGLEWIHRLITEPRRLAKRYLFHGIPFAIRLLIGTIYTRIRHGARHPF